MDSIFSGEKDDEIGYFELLGAPDIEIEDVLLGNLQILEVKLLS